MRSHTGYNSINTEYAVSSPSEIREVNAKISAQRDQKTSTRKSRTLHGSAVFPSKRCNRSIADDINDSLGLCPTETQEDSEEESITNLSSKRHSGQEKNFGDDEDFQRIKPKRRNSTPKKNIDDQERRYSHSGAHSGRKPCNQSNPEYLPNRNAGETRSLKDCRSSGGRISLSKPNPILRHKSTVNLSQRNCRKPAPDLNDDKTRVLHNIGPNFNDEKTRSLHRIGRSEGRSRSSIRKPLSSKSNLASILCSNDTLGSFKLLTTEELKTPNTDDLGEITDRSDTQRRKQLEKFEIAEARSPDHDEERFNDKRHKSKSLSRRVSRSKAKLLSASEIEELAVNINSKTNVGAAENFESKKKSPKEPKTPIEFSEKKNPFPIAAEGGVEKKNCLPTEVEKDTEKPKRSQTIHSKNTLDTEIKEDSLVTTEKATCSSFFSIFNACGISLGKQELERTEAGNESRRDFKVNIESTNSKTVPEKNEPKTKSELNSEGSSTTSKTVSDKNENSEGTTSKTVSDKMEPTMDNMLSTTDINVSDQSQARRFLKTTQEHQMEQHQQLGFQKEQNEQILEQELIQQQLQLHQHLQQEQLMKQQFMQQQLMQQKFLQEQQAMKIIMQQNYPFSSPLTNMMYASPNSQLMLSPVQSSVSSKNISHLPAQQLMYGIQPYIPSKTPIIQMPMHDLNLPLSYNSPVSIKESDSKNDTLESMSTKWLRNVITGDDK